MVNVLVVEGGNLTEEYSDNAWVFIHQEAIDLDET